jgi:hypothetical protein
MLKHVADMRLPQPNYKNTVLHAFLHEDVPLPGTPLPEEEFVPIFPRSRRPGHGNADSSAKLFLGQGVKDLARAIPEARIDSDDSDMSLARATMEIVDGWRGSGSIMMMCIYSECTRYAQGFFPSFACNAYDESRRQQDRSVIFGRLSSDGAHYWTEGRKDRSAASTRGVIYINTKMTLRVQRRSKFHARGVSEVHMAKMLIYYMTKRRAK